jgi:hypothetical protein
VGKMPLKRIVEAVDINPKTLYDKIDFIYEQCVAFSGARERKLSNLHTPRLYLGVDRQTYVVNWTRRDDRRNVMLTAVAAADNHTHYVLGAILNFDHDVDPGDVEAETLALGDASKGKPFVAMQDCGPKLTTSRQQRLQ